MEIVLLYILKLYIKNSFYQQLTKAMTTSKNNETCLDNMLDSMSSTIDHLLLTTSTYLQFDKWYIQITLCLWAINNFNLIQNIAVYCRNLILVLHVQAAVQASWQCLNWGSLVWEILLWLVFSSHWYSWTYCTWW